MPVMDLPETTILATLRAFLLDVLPAGTPVIKAQINRVPEPLSENFVLMTPIMRSRISTNEDGFNDVEFRGFIIGNLMTVTDVEFGSIVVGSPVYGAGVAAGTLVTAPVSGVGGIGTYAVSPSQEVPPGMDVPLDLLTEDGDPLLTQGGLILTTEGDEVETMFAGTMAARQATMVTVQLDVHGPVSADNVQRITTLFRDMYACDFFAAIEPEVQPLYTSEPRQAPFINGEAQVEYRWSVDAVMQANPVVTVPQRFADQVIVDLEPVT